MFRFQLAMVLDGMDLSLEFGEVGIVWLFLDDLEELVDTLVV